MVWIGRGKGAGARGKRSRWEASPNALSVLFQPKPKMAGSLLTAILSNQDIAANGSFIVITDSVVQPGLILLKQFITNSLLKSVTQDC